MIGERWRIPVVFENYAELQYKAGPDNVNIVERYYPLWRFILKHVAVAIPASEHCAKGPRLLSPAGARIGTVYSGINFDIFAAGGLKDKTAMRTSFGLPEDRFIVMAVGALKMRKGHDQLFEALLEMNPLERPRVFVVLCGMGDVSDMEEKAKALGFGTESMKVFQGLTEERLAELYATADCFCFPSVTPRECMGMAMKEAMACGLPIAAYDTGGIKEAVIDGKGGYLAPVGDRKALAGRIERIMHATPAERREMGAFNAARTREIFDIRVTARKLYDILVDTVAKYDK
jgi:glycosyltransferase involved in cell wall biosynthesis